VDIVLLCKVVDNYGDIGVVYRLARSLSELPAPPALRLVVDDLSSFRCLDPEVDPGLDRQSLHGWELFRWSAAEAALPAFRARRPKIVIECFACGRPDWLESLLFEESSAEGCLLVDLEHLTAEPYAVEFHRMPSLTRSSSVRKAMFLPGFAPGTGGLVMDGDFAGSRELASSEEGRVALRLELLASLRAAARRSAPRSAVGGGPEDFWLPVFSYERDYSRIVADLAAFSRSLETRSRTGGRRLLALAAAGKSQACFLRAWEAAGRPFPALELPFLPQETWDRFILASDFSIVRGEDSWARAALSGRPFLWQAYPQEGRHQLVKVEAFLELLRPFITEGDRAPLEDAYRALNDRDLDGAGTAGSEALLPLLESYESLLRGFMAFSADLAPRANLAADLVTFLCELV
jgi:uncharacterized repeat protein (TIGR03837 family)